jgi:hypothetical protein
MTEISLTDFVDFVIKSGTPKLTKVRYLKQRPAYNPAFDYWKQMREGIQEMHRSGNATRAELNAIVEGLDNNKKVGRYRAAVNGYAKFLGRRRITWFEPPASDWVQQSLTVRVNPELGLKIGDDPYLVKLYFKDEALTSARVTIVLDMMSLVLSSKSPPGTRMAVLDVSNGRLLCDTNGSADTVVLLQGEAAAFVEMWKRL